MTCCNITRPSPAVSDACSQQPRNRYILLRHGQSQGNARDIISTDPCTNINSNGLTAFGRGQVAKAIENALAEKIIRRGSQIWSSDFLRTRESAEIVSNLIGNVPIHCSRELRERRAKKGDGKSGSFYRKHIWGCDRNSTSHFDPETESVADVARRMWNFMSQIESANSGEELILVTHCDPAQILRSLWYGKDIQTHMLLNSLPCAGIVALPVASRRKFIPAEVLWS